jgi:hypothetical protein
MEYTRPIQLGSTAMSATRHPAGKSSLERACTAKAMRSNKSTSTERLRRIARRRQDGAAQAPDDIDWLVDAVHNFVFQGFSTLDAAAGLAPGAKTFMRREDLRAALAMIEVPIAKSGRSAAAVFHDQLARYFRTRFRADRRSGLCPAGTAGTFYQLLVSNGDEMPSVETVRRKWLTTKELVG